MKHPETWSFNCVRIHTTHISNNNAVACLPSPQNLKFIIKNVKCIKRNLSPKNLQTNSIHEAQSGYFMLVIIEEKKKKFFFIIFIQATGHGYQLNKCLVLYINKAKSPICTMYI